MKNTAHQMMTHDALIIVRQRRHVMQMIPRYLVVPLQSQQFFATHLLTEPANKKPTYKLLEISVSYCERKKELGCVIQDNMIEKKKFPSGILI